MTEMTRLARELSTRRWARGYSISRLSKVSGISASTISRMEAGRADVPVIDLIRVFDTLGSDFLELLTPTHTVLASVPNDTPNSLTKATWFLDAVVRSQKIQWRLKASVKHARESLAESRKLKGERRSLFARAQLALQQTGLPLFETPFQEQQVG